jgi:hypothetical protein
MLLDSHVHATTCDQQQPDRPVELKPEELSDECTISPSRDSEVSTETSAEICSSNAYIEMFNLLGTSSDHAKCTVGPLHSQIAQTHLVQHVPVSEDGDAPPP